MISTFSPIEKSKTFSFAPFKAASSTLHSVNLAPPISPTSLIQIEGLTKAYNVGENVLNGVSLGIEAGEIYGIIGRSGAGKSTLVRCLNGLEQPSAGSVLIDGLDITKLKGAALRQARRGIGMIFQHFNLLSSRTVSANVALPLEMAGVDKKTIQQRVPELLALVGLDHKAEAYPAELSGGQKQRVGIARALSLQPKILLCDEISSALDPEATEQILALLKDINQRLGLTIIMISHEMETIRNIATHVAVLEQGRIVESGSTYDVFAAPKTDTARRFISGVVSHELPLVIQQRLLSSPQANSHPVIRVVQAGVTANVPIISLLQQQFNVTAHLLYGRVDYIGDQPLGVLTLVLQDADNAPTSILHWMHAQQFQVEVVGYVV